MAKAIKTVGPIRTPEGRLSFPHLYAPEMTGRFPCRKFVTSFLIPKTSDLTALIAACVKAAQQEWPTAGITNANQIRVPFKDGDAKPGKGADGCWVIKCKSKNKPLIVDRTAQPFAGTVKGGDFAYLSVKAFPYVLATDGETAAVLRANGKLILAGTNEEGQAISGRPAVTFFLEAVQFLREGVAFAGTGANGTSVFEAQAAPVSEGNLFDAI